MTGLLPVGSDQVTAARATLAGITAVTPVLDLTALAPAGMRLVAKAENRQHTGSFKYRGATNRLAAADIGPAGVVAYSSGIHGAAVARAAARIEVPALIVVPEGASPAKLAAIRDAGAGLEFYAPGADRAVHARRIAERDGATLVAPYDDPLVIAGQGTVALELVEQVPDLGLVVTPVGGGGLAAGMAIALAGSDVRVVGVEPAGADDTVRSLRAGRRVRRDTVDTVADGLRTPMPGELTFPVVQQLVDRVVSVPDEAIIDTMRLLWQQFGERVEPSGAVALAAVLSGNVATRHGATAVVLSGGTIADDQFRALIA